MPPEEAGAPQGQPGERAEDERDRRRQQRHLELVTSASRAPWLWAASFHQWRVNPLGGQAKVRSTLKEFTSTSASGT